MASITTTPHVRLDSDDDFPAIFETVRMLGKGSFGDVWSCRRCETGTDNETLWAVKIIEKKKAGGHDMRMVELEIGVLKRAKHPNIILLREVYESPQKAYLVMELCQGGSLDQYYLTADGEAALSERQVARITEQLTMAVAYLHDNGIAHRDLKLENVMLRTHNLDNLELKLTDFGLSAVKSKDTQMEMVCGTPKYIAPEVLADHGSYSPLCDLWSIGVMIYLMLSGRYPFHGSDMHSLLASIEEMVGQKTFPEGFWQDIPDAAQDALRRLLVADPAQRMTAKELLAHRWILSHSDRPCVSVTGDGCGQDDVSSSSSPGGDRTVLEMMKDFARDEQMSSGGGKPKSVSPNLARWRKPAQPVSILDSAAASGGLVGTARNPRPSKDESAIAQELMGTTRARRETKDTKTVPRYMQATKASSGGKTASPRSRRATRPDTADGRTVIRLMPDQKQRK